MADHCGDQLLLSTCVSMGNEDEMHRVNEQKLSPTQAFSGYGCRPTRVWIVNQLKKYFDFVYLPITQPSHPEFITDWKNKDHGGKLQRAVFIASRKPINNPLLVDGIPDVQYQDVTKVPS